MQVGYLRTDELNPKERQSTMKVHQMLVQEIVRNLEFREAFITELEVFADLAIEFKEVKEESAALAETFRTITREDIDPVHESASDVVDVGDSFIRVPDGELIIEGDEYYLPSLQEWKLCFGLVGSTASNSLIARRPYRPIHGWPMEAGWRELSEQEVLRDGDEVNSVFNGPESDGWIASYEIGMTYRDYHMVARRRIA